MNKRGGAFLPLGILPHCWVREVPATLSSAAHGISDPPLDAKLRRHRIGRGCPIFDDSEQFKEISSQPQATVCPHWQEREGEY